MKLYPDQFLGLQPGEKNKADVLLIPVPFEKTVSYGTGTRRGPRAIIDASCELELFDEETLINFETDLTIHTAPAILPDLTAGTVDFLAHLSREYTAFRDTFTITIGGEHTITYGTVMGLAPEVKDVTIVHIDAHADLIDELEGQKWSHGTCMKRLLEKGCSLIQVGIRSCSYEEYQLIERSPGIRCFFAHQVQEEWDSLIRTLGSVKNDVYLSLDVDGLDPSVIPSTGTPQPGGLSWYQTMTIIKTICANTGCRLIGADLVEYIACPHPPSYDSIAAKLLYKIIAYWAHYRKKSGG
jgi:agmatinase